MTPHQLRHTYITNLIHASVDPKTVQYLAGHENSKITMDIYAKVKYNKPHELASAMEDISIRKAPQIILILYVSVKLLRERQYGYI